MCARLVCAHTTHPGRPSEINLIDRAGGVIPAGVKERRAGVSRRLVLPSEVEGGDAQNRFASFDPAQVVARLRPFRWNQVQLGPPGRGVPFRTRPGARRELLPS